MRFADQEIPRDDGLLMIPGEDLFYYATGRRPRFPVLLFDHTVNPYSPEEIIQDQPGAEYSLAGGEAGSCSWNRIRSRTGSV